MTSRIKPSRIEKELGALEPALKNPDEPASREALRAALVKAHSFAVEKAAGVIRDRLLSGFETELKAAFDRFLQNPIKSDPGCKAKLAVLEALDFLEELDCAPFVKAIHHFQLEPAWGPPVDTATGVRSRGALALARQGHTDFPLFMAELLSDPEAPVRQSAAEAVAHRGDPAGAGLLELKLRLGDKEPRVLLACMSGLISLAPAWGAPKAGSFLTGANEELREIGALALGQSRRDDAVTLLLAALHEELLGHRRALLLRALGLHRSERSLEALLEAISKGNAAEAKAAIDALGHRSFEPGLPERVLKAARANADRSVEEAARTAFRARG